MSKIEKIALKNPIIKMVIQYDPDAFLVGGFIRDLLRGVRPNKIQDIDFACKDPKRIADYLSRKTHGSIVRLKKDNIRVALKNGTTIDLSPIEKDIISDLRRRDFTINSIAWSVNKGLIDPYSGINDINKRVIRHILRENFIDDPLRILRIYRFSSELCFDIDKGTRLIAKSLSSRLGSSASERITAEFLRLLDGGCALKALMEAAKDRVIDKIISLDFKGLNRNIKRFSLILSNLESMSLSPKDISPPSGISVRGLFGLESLLIGSSGDNLCLSSALRRRVEIVKELFEDFRRAKKDSLYELFNSSREAIYDLLIISGRLGLIGEAKRFLRIKKRGILRAEEIIEITGLSGAKLGWAIEEIKRLQFEGEIRTKAEAKRILKKI